MGHGGQQAESKLVSSGYSELQGLVRRPPRASLRTAQPGTNASWQLMQYTVGVRTSLAIRSRLASKRGVDNMRRTTRSATRAAATGTPDPVERTLSPDPTPSQPPPPKRAAKAKTKAELGRELAAGMCAGGTAELAATALHSVYPHTR
jgi:hypothetical protein